MILRRATAADAEKLTANREEFVSSIRTIHDREAFHTATLAFFKAHAEAGDTVIYIAEEDGQIVSAAMACIYATAPLASSLNGLAAEVLNVYTLAQYRRRGIAAALMRLTADEARRRGVGRLWLDATPDGSPLYRSLGFTANGRIMELKL